MDRLTERDQGGNGVCGSQYRCEEPCHECAHHKNILNLLAAYEDTGLTPEEIKELKATIDAFKDDVEPNQEVINFLKNETELRKWIKRCAWHCRKVHDLNVELEQVKAERDAAVEDLKSVCEGINSCAFCIHDLRGTEENWPTEHCSPQWRTTKEYCWQWRGLEGRA